jgi:Hg(II)-responsive transcriptional regulator
MARNTIGQVAARAGVGVETIRFYERSGLIRRPDAPNGGFREYPEEVVDRVRFIRHGKELGFALIEIADLLSLRTHPRSNCEEVRERVARKIKDVDGRIRSLRKIKTQLQKLATACDQRAGSSDCPILEALD